MWLATIAFFALPSPVGITSIKVPLVWKRVSVFRRGFHDTSDDRAKRLLIVMQKKWLWLRIYSKK
jgi:hypothetical protein